VFPSSTMWPWRGLLRTKWRLHPSSSLVTIDMNRKGGAATPSNTTSPGPIFTSIPSGILIHPTVWPQQIWAKNWVGAGAVPLFLGRAGFPSNSKSPGPRPTSIPSFILVHPAVWPQRTLAENWELRHFRGGGAGSPSNTMSPSLRPTSLLSGILIHPAV